MGDRVPMIEHQMENLDGKMMHLESLTGEKGLLVVFSCNTCPFVVGSDNFEGWEKQYNDLNKFAANYGFKMVLINSNEAKRDHDDSPDAMKKRAKEKGYTMPYLIDKKLKQLTLIKNLLMYIKKTVKPHAFYALWIPITLLKNTLELKYFQKLYKIKLNL